MLELQLSYAVYRRTLPGIEADAREITILNIGNIHSLQLQ